MLDHMILTVSNVERSLAFYEAALKPLSIKFFLPTRAKATILICGDLVMARERSSGSNKGSLIQRPFTGDSWPKTMVWSMNSTGRQYPRVPGIIFHRGHEWNTIRDTTPPTYLTRTGIRSKSSIRASDGTSHRQRTVADIGNRWMTSNHSRETSAPTRVYFVDSPNPGEDGLALQGPGHRLKCYQIGAARTDERHPPK